MSRTFSILEKLEFGFSLILFVVSIYFISTLHLNTTECPRAEGTMFSLLISSYCLFGLMGLVSVILAIVGFVGIILLSIKNKF
jgi:hypothetical protein